MRIFLIRHGETEHNVAGLLAGVTDSLLTNHGLVQAQRLDLKRAFRTANEICVSQNARYPEVELTPIQLAVLREQDFGSFELLPWNRSAEARENDPKPSDHGFKPKETTVEMKDRADTFLDDSFLPLLALDTEVEQFVAIVSHGLFLAAIWRALLLRFKPSTVSFVPEIALLVTRKGLEYLPSWSNTGCLELFIQEKIDATDSSARVEGASNGDINDMSLNATLRIMSVNSKDHLISLKRTRGGVGSSTSDDSQKRLDGFFKKRKVKDMPRDPVK